MDSSPAPAPAPSATAEAFLPAPAATDGTATGAEFPATPPAPAATESSSTTRADSTAATTRADSTAATTRAEFPASPPAPAATESSSTTCADSSSATRADSTAATTRAEFPASPPAPAATNSSSATRADSTTSPPAADATNASPQTRAEPPASPLGPAVSSRELSWAIRLAQVGGGIEDCGTYLGGWETSLRARSQFFLQVAGYMPEAYFSGIVVWVAWACRGISQFLGHLASMAKEASGLCLLVGGGVKRLAEGLGTADGDVENPDAAPRFIMITSLAQLRQVVVTNRGSPIRLQVDVDPAMTPSLAKSCYEILNAEGMYGHEMMQNAQNLIQKLAELEEVCARRQPPRSPDT